MNIKHSARLMFSLYVTYEQIAVFHSGLEAPFSNWTQAHVDQGFAWRPESVSFRCLEEVGQIVVSVAVNEQVTLRPDTRRAIAVPFVVPAGGWIEIASITDGNEVQVAEGAYALVFQTGIDSSGAMWCDLSFIKSEHPSFTVLRADLGLCVSNDLLKTAEPA